MVTRLRTLDSGERVVERARGMDHAGIPEVRRVLDVEHDATMLTAQPDSVSTECQACREPVATHAEHSRAWVRRDSNGTFAKLVFCDRECWTSWASSGP